MLPRARFLLVSTGDCKVALTGQDAYEVTLARLTSRMKPGQSTPPPLIPQSAKIRSVSITPPCNKPWCAAFDLLIDTGVPLILAREWRVDRHS